MTALLVERFHLIDKEFFVPTFASGRYRNLHHNGYALHVG
jgi:hypothetical protein